MACTTRRGRQQPGFACEECRRRKARCDRVRPKCGFCTENELQCVFVDKRQQRGPVKGQINSMQSQLATLRWQLDRYLRQRPDHPIAMTVESDEPPTDIQTMLDDFDVQVAALNQDGAMATTTALMPATTTTSNDAPAGLSWPDATWLDCQWQEISTSLIPPDLTAVSTTTALTDPLSLDILNESPPPPTTADSSSSRVKMTDLIRAELDQLYFDRVHAFCPIIHRRRYFTLVAQTSTPAQVCLQSAMRTLAAAMSSHYQLGEQLYSETRVLLETHSQTPATPRDKIPLEHIQAWLLLSHYELLRMGVHQAMLTAGRAFRLVQMARLSELDASADLQLSPVSPSPSLSLSLSSGVESSESFVDAEEGRRTFWLAFCFDRLLCLQNEWPLTLQEEMISTRLPCPEHNYQNNLPIRTPFLPEAMAQTGQNTLSPFSECIIMATLHGRCMTHRRFYANPNNTNASDFESGPTKRDFCIRQNWLSNAVDRRVQTLSQMPSPTVDSDPMLLFTHMLGYRATVHISNTMQQVSWRTSSVDQQLLGPGTPVSVSAVAYQQRAAHAAGEIVRLAKAVPALSPFKAHPFLPDALACAATFLSIHGSGSAGEAVQHVLRVLGELQDTHSLARDYLQGLQTPGEGNRQDTWFLQ
ncbi:Asperfuranone cluster transcription factor afoA [Aspergillus mulundensis]|uniref:Asperfuranone cluster transcription factor afoA n=1 Tax=Aspergillus mulundensis TaxID=1810919 RepID=A0A3D8RRU7_9EURO|nr:Asperfuranone cluster transcription factor afoA [Aspergillus mulundensis]RDW76678.1 Asperfuranone cluster transcription factor afoA [Aspergillus mulundensis]